MAEAEQEPQQETPEVEGAAVAVDPSTPDAPAKDKAPEETGRLAPALPEGQHYIWGTGRRKSSVARVRIRPGSGKILINKREVEDYFRAEKDQRSAIAPLETARMRKSWDVWANVNGGGITGQADAVKLGLARAISKVVPDVEHDFRNKGYLTRDARMKERKKPGQPGARKRFQFSKR